MKKWLSKDDAYELLLSHVRRYPCAEEEPTSFEEALEQLLNAHASATALVNEVDSFVAELNEKELLNFIPPTKKMTNVQRLTTFAKKAFTESQVAANFISNKKLLGEFIKYRDEFLEEVNEEPKEEPKDTKFVA